MKIVFHEKYYTSDYSFDPAASVGRLDGIMKIINSKKEEYDYLGVLLNGYHALAVILGRVSQQGAPRK